MNADDTLDATQVAKLLGADREKILQLARNGELPGTRIGRSWVFLREDAISFLKKQIARETEERRQRRTSLSAGNVILRSPINRRRKSLPELPSIVMPSIKK